MKLNKRSVAACGAALAATGAAVAGVSQANASDPANVFHMHRSPGFVAVGCLPDAKARVEVRNHGPVEVMKIHATGLPSGRTSTSS